MRVNKTHTGARMICQCTVKPEMIKRTTKIISEIKKSTRQTNVTLKEMMIFGKYTFENKLELPTIELLTSLKTLAKSCQRTIDDAT
jgi:hypothetical protein